MAVFRSLNALIRNRNSKRLFLTVSATTAPLPRLSSILSPLPLSFASRFTYSRSRVLSPLSISIPFPGPLFLSFPPWKLSQSATPLLLQGEVVLRNVEALKLLRNRNFPICLGRFGSIPASPGLLGRLDPKEVISRDVDVDVAHGDFVNTFMNLPNLISFSRLASGPLLAWMISNEWYLSAFMGLTISGATDWLDGFMARKMGINSVIGSYLDPLADKVLIGCVALAMVEKDLIHPGLVGLVVLRDVALIFGAVYKRASSLGWQWKSWFDFFNLDGMCPEKVEPLFISKVNTVLQLILVTGALLQPEFGTEETKLYITYLSWLVASTTVGSTAAYGAEHMRNGSKIIARTR